MASGAATSGWNMGIGGLNGAGAIWKVNSALTLVQLGYAGSNILQKLLFTGGTNIIVFSVYRDIVSISCLVPIAYFAERGRRTPLDWRTLSLMVLLGFIGMYIAQLSLTLGVALAPPTYACLIGITTPIFVYIISAVSGLEETSLKTRGGQAKMVGVLSAVSGGVLIPVYKGPEIVPPLRRGLPLVPSVQSQQDIRGVVAPILSSLNIEDWQLGGFLLIFCGSLYAVYWTLQAYATKRYPAPISISAVAYISAAIMLAVTGLLTIEDRTVWAFSFRPLDVVSILYVGLISSGMNFALQSWALLESGPVLIAAYAPLQSFATIAMAYLFLDDSIHLGSVLGLVCILSGLFLITWGQVASRKEAGHPVKALQSTLDGNVIIKGDSNLEQHLLG